MDISAKLRSWPTVVSFILALFPIAILIFIVVTLIDRSHIAIEYRGLSELLSGRFVSRITGSEPFSYGFLPAVWGTFILLVVTLAIALPISLALAIFASEHSTSFPGRMLRGLIGILAGIPPVVYAVIGVLLFNNLFVIPYQSTLTGGILLAMVAIPFMTPLIDDAIMNVPHHLKEGSLALGATRWHTLQKIILPAALPGIVAAAGLGALKSIGDIMIAFRAIGYAPYIPHPFWDILSVPAPLTVTGAGLVGGVDPQVGAGGDPNTVQGLETSVSYFSGIVLLVMALLIMVLVTILQRRFKKRLS